MPITEQVVTRDERLATVPMWIIEAVRAEARLKIHAWSEMARHVEESITRDEQVLPCDVELPPATVFPQGTKVSTLMLGIQQRLDLPANAHAF